MQTPNLRPAVFLDRDGVINENRSDHVKNWREFHFLPFAFEALRRLNKSPYLVIVVTNQAAIGRGLVSQETVDEIHRQMRDWIEREGGRIDAIYVCPHKPDEGCGCRKPQPGMFLEAARDYQIDLANSFTIGDKLTDLLPGEILGSRGILVGTGDGLPAGGILPERAITVDNLLDAVRSITDQEKR
jgi:D-glycero-D-manno-heptose 1,7-bisphosphate phosphatase